MALTTSDCAPSEDGHLQFPITADLESYGAARRRCTPPPNDRLPRGSPPPPPRRPHHARCLLTATHRLQSAGLRAWSVASRGRQRSSTRHGWPPVLIGRTANGPRSVAACPPPAARRRHRPTEDVCCGGVGQRAADQAEGRDGRVLVQPAPDEASVVLLHPPLHLAGASMWMDRGWTGDGQGGVRNMTVSPTARYNQPNHGHMEGTIDQSAFYSSCKIVRRCHLRRPPATAGVVCSHGCRQHAATREAAIDQWIDRRATAS